MTFAIITHTPHFLQEENVLAYGPYVREMNLWIRHVEKVIVVAPISKAETSKIHAAYHHEQLRIYRIPKLGFVTPTMAVLSVLLLPWVLFQMLRAMTIAKHIHLRCPGTIGLVGCVVQVLFPWKKKTAKYAGNWDPEAKQPFSYRLQKKILRNTLVTRNMDVLVYGDWPLQTANITSFFTATYSNEKIPEVLPKEMQLPVRCIFVGALTPGKQPMYAVELVHTLREKGIATSLDIYGDGAERLKLEAWINAHEASWVTLHGNQTAETVENAYKSAHFLLLPSRSEGWPKVVAEAMFWGCIPVALGVSCIPWMLDGGNRGVLLTGELPEDASRLHTLIASKETYTTMSLSAQHWSHQYTLDAFETAIKKLLI
ncbi:glycosyltransferase family 4 protein [Altibacter sp. HG106]|uniref:glycosyltransferase family 4 protein n=1 Tax=Altibacter sp. HG106 TaxID=3023937 RepID=UPI0023502615|nr:glycosyltransferase [Altibacter sp. HG106]MDC7995693.1 glycosyltransferase [Altibacter sp. HG106]